jgi:flagellar protein FliO/FliZ
MRVECNKNRATHMNWFLITLLLCVAMIGGGLLLRSYMTGGAVLPGFGPRPERRLAVLEQASIDSRRRLILIRRDNVEHLIMTGGPVDVVVETGIGSVPVRTRPLLAEAETTKPPVTFGRAARPAGQVTGQAVGE